MRETPLHVRSIRTLRRNNPFRVLGEHRNFRIFWIGQTLSLIGTWMQAMGEGWLALELTNNAFLVTLVTAVGAVPVLALSLQAGVVADRIDKLKIVRVMQALMLCQSVTLWLVTLTGHVTIGWLLGLAALNGLFSAFEIPARQSMIIELVNREDLAGAIALNSSGFNLARIVGPAIGAVVIAKAGIAWCFALNAASYLAVLVGLFMLRLAPRTPRTRRTDGSEMRAGIRYMLRTTEVRVIMILVTGVSICAAPYLALMPVVARDRLGTGAGGYGSLLTAVGIGGFAGALFLAAVGSRVPRGRLLLWSTLVFAVMLLALAATRHFHAAWLILLVVGCAMILNGALCNAILQAIVPDEFRGRLMAAYSLVVVGLSQVAGNFVAGAVARVLGPQWAIAGGATIVLGLTAWAYTAHRELVRI
ncbi:MAG TPA: MFS transporter [Gemmatimonadaceae bacterium]|nr:MFS transporter [Gemmatimonadaceae bacterium]